MGNRTNKKERQIADRQKHLHRRNQPSLGRGEESIPQKEKLLIVCEGRNTEPSYFRQFRYSTAKIESIKIIGEGYNTLSLVERAEELKNKKYPDYEVWCVFDADPKPDNPQQLINFTNAVNKAEALGYGVAYSHQAFEYWLILHFEDHQGGSMDRALYYKKINDYLSAINPKVEYDKDSKLITEGFFTILLATDPKTGKPRQQLAIERAMKIYERYDHVNPANEESSTTVFRLVKKLNNQE